jgi:hypothetical protein
MRHERTPAEFLGERETFRVVDPGAGRVDRITERDDLGEDAQRRSL